MHVRTDRRTWLKTDRPREFVAIGAPLENVRLMSARNSDRCWSEYHTTFSVCVITFAAKSSAATYRCRGEHTAVAGDLMTFEPGDHHVTTRVYGRAGFELITFEPSELDQAARELGLRGAVHFKAAKLRSDAVALAAARFVAGTSRGASVLQLQCLYTDLLRTMLNHCCEALPEQASPRGIPHAGVRRVLRYLRENYRLEPTLAELSGLAGLSRFGLAHAFTKHAGVPPSAYLRLRRLAEARRLIERGMSIDEVATKVGYGDATALTRAIKAHLGVPPARWRRVFYANSEPVFAMK